MIERPNYVRVVNTDKMRVVGRFGGEDFEFLPNKPNDVPVIVARHIFGFGDENKVNALNRLGWLQTSDQLDKAMEKLSRIIFTEAPPLVEATMPEPQGLSTSELMPHGTSPSSALSPEVSSGRSGVPRAPGLPKPPAR